MQEIKKYIYVQIQTLKWQILSIFQRQFTVIIIFKGYKDIINRIILKGDLKNIVNENL